MPNRSTRSLRDRLYWAAGQAVHRLSSSLPASAQVAPGVTVGRSVTGTDNVAFEGAAVIGRGTSLQGWGIAIGRSTTIGLGCIINGPVEIGRYCQFGSNVGVYGVDHPIDVAVPNVNQQFLRGQVGGLVRPAEVRIGHGCWIGHGAVILRGVSVGNGSVVGAGAVVRNDVAAYSTVAGVPAGPSRPRFATDLAEALDRLEWWGWSDERLEANRELFLTSLRDEPERARRLLHEAT